MEPRTLADKLTAAGKYDDMSQYQSLKESAEREREGVIKYYEHLAKQHGDVKARETMRQRGYNPALLKR